MICRFLSDVFLKNLAKFYLFLRLQLAISRKSLTFSIRFLSSDQMNQSWKRRLIQFVSLFLFGFNERFWNCSSGIRTKYGYFPSFFKSHFYYFNNHTKNFNMARVDNMNWKNMFFPLSPFVGTYLSQSNRFVVISKVCQCIKDWQ